MIRRTATAPGFTLIEVMVALVILSTVLSLMYGTFSHSIETRDRLDRHIAWNEAGRSILMRLERDLSGAYQEVKWPASTNANPQTDEAKVKHTGLLIAQDTLNGRQASTLQFTTRSRNVFLLERGDGNEFSHGEIGYLPVWNDEAETMQMWRREDPTLDDAPMEGGTPFLMIDDVIGFQIRAFDAARKEWVNEWDTAESGALPVAIEFTIRFGTDVDNVESQYVYGGTIRLPEITYDLRKNVLSDGTNRGGGGQSSGGGGNGKPGAGANDPLSGLTGGGGRGKGGGE